MVTEAQKDAMRNKIMWSANRNLRIGIGLMFCFGVLVAEGIFGHGWESGAIKSTVTAILLVALETVITAWKNK